MARLLEMLAMMDKCLRINSEKSSRKNSRFNRSVPHPKFLNWRHCYKTILCHLGCLENKLKHYLICLLQKLNLFLMFIFQLLYSNIVIYLKGKSKLFHQINYILRFQNYCKHNIVYNRYVTWL